MFSNRTTMRPIPCRSPKWLYRVLPRNWPFDCWMISSPRSPLGFICSSARISRLGFDKGKSTRSGDRNGPDGFDHSQQSGQIVTAWDGRLEGIRYFWARQPEESPSGLSESTAFSAISTRLRPPRFALYSAASARSSSLSKLSCSPARATPIETVTCPIAP